MLTLETVARHLVRRYVTGPITAPVRRALLRNVLIPQLRPIARSGAELLRAARAAGVGISTSDYYRMLREARTETEGGGEYPTARGESLGAVPTIHSYGRAPWRYDLELYWPSDRPGYWDVGRTSVWSDEPLEADEIYERVREHLADLLSRDPSSYRRWYQHDELPADMWVATTHVYEAHELTGRRFW